MMEDEPRYGMPSDIWALGILAYELATGSKVPVNEDLEESKE